MDLAGQTRTAFYRAQADEQMLDMFQQIVLATQAGYEFAQRLVEAGNIPELDLLLQQGLYERSKLDLASAEVAVAESLHTPNSTPPAAPSKWPDIDLVDPMTMVFA